jgi:Trk-type K+ transport system membrane component
MLKNWLKKFPAIFSLFTLIAVLYDLGFDQSRFLQEILYDVYLITLLIGVISTFSRYFTSKNLQVKRIIWFDLISIAFFLIIIFNDLSLLQHGDVLSHFKHINWKYGALVLVFVREASALQINFSRTLFNPAQFFVLSFFLIIFLGTLLLLLPNATVGDLSFMDAAFTSTSAVCVTGLIVVDTGTYFTIFGKVIILVLIQIGGIGIMTFASYFSYFFSGGSSYENQLVLSDMTSSNKLGEVFTTLKKIIVVTFTLETIGALLIFFTLDSKEIYSYLDKGFFSVFHSISAFCNAGFSTLGNSLYEGGFRFNYGLQSIIMILFIIGGLGFPIVFNLFNYVTYLFKNRIFRPFIGKEKKQITPWVINLNSRIVLITTGILLILGSTVFFAFEYHNSLAEHTFGGKIITSIFSAATPRTAGFNTVDTSALHFSTIMLIFLLMWIGASPASTGGGIKTSTFAIATLNFWSLARGKERLELFRREVADISIRRAFAIISLSLVVIGMGIFSIAFFDSDQKLIDIGFECFSAYSTVGLSLGITESLSNPSKFVLIVLMFTGRVGMLSLLIAITKKEKRKHYRYSQEEILIN